MKTHFFFPASRQVSGYGRRAGWLLALAGLGPVARAQTFAPVATYATGTIPQDIATVDVNGDGRLDIITANSNTNTVGVLLGSATTPGTFPATATFYGSGGNFPVGLGVGDVNGDGRPDIVVANASSNTVGVLLNSATTPGTFLAAVTYGSGTIGPRGLGLTDLNGDGRPDVVMGGNSSNVGVLLNSATTPGTFGAALTYPTGVAADGIAVGDVDGDGQPDVAVTGYQTTNTITILLNSAATPGTFLTPTAYGSGGVKPRGVTLADVNGDGRADIVAGNETSNTVGVLLNLAAAPGTFGAAAAYASGASGPDGVRVRDMNGDGRPDIVATNYNVSTGTTVSVLLNLAAPLGTFATGTTYSSGGQGPVGLALGDLNNDGRPDIAATNVLSATVGVLLNTTVPAPLPVQLVAFTAEAQGPGALLRWTTASEVNNARFEVESSPDGIRFARLGKVAGAGSSARAHAYSWVDENVARYATPLVYYRLRQVDTDGTATYSPVRTVAGGGTSPAALALYPTVAGAGQPVRYAYAGPTLAAGATLDVYDATGRRVASQVPAGPAGTLAVAALLPGWYWVRLAGTGAVARFCQP